ELPHDPTVDFPHGTPARDIIAGLVAPGDVERAYRDLDAGELACADRTRAMPGAVELTASLPVERWAVVTSAGRPLAEARLAAAGHAPRHVVSADDVTRGKPNPEPYRRGAAVLGMDPSRLAVFEDAAAGVAAARAAGIGLVVGVGDELDPASVDVLLPDLRSARLVEADDRLVLELDS
uniref:HAD-IA family hydrolase n=1 Tax=Luteococcus sp. TaxID=1969402 RepID=UPI003734CF40